ncbi:MAG: substrate-binding domain-containing protein, partial [Spirochaetales bacterium]|nr:substrate-binding domain-containing protein [Spirochaetales bacterium]
MGQMRMLFVVVVLCLGAAIGFAGGQGDDAEIQSEIAIGISVIGTTHNWDINAFNGAINRARELGARVVAFDGERRTEKQLSDIGSLISIGVDAIIVILGDAQSLTPALAEARAAGIPIVTADFDNPHTVSNVSTDNEEAMAELVEYLVQDIDESGQLGIFYTPGIPIADQRKRV